MLFFNVIPVPGAFIFVPVTGIPAFSRRHAIGAANVGLLAVTPQKSHCNTVFLEQQIYYGKSTPWVRIFTT
ncbi:MAG TPA: hypothetical protein VF490_01685, partial [Chryseosolibacter sp.]